MNRCVRVSACLLLCACAASPALASSARLLALGGDGAYLEDAVNARVWYGSLVDHGGWAALESGVFSQEGYARDLAGWRRTGPAAGTQVPVGPDGRHGTAGLWWNSRLGNGGIGDLGAAKLTDAWQVMYGRRLGGLSAGLSVRHGGGEHEPAPDLARNLTRDDFGLGARLDLGRQAYLDVAGEIVRLGQKTSLSGAEPDSRSTARSFGLRGRVFAQIADGIVAAPVLAYRREIRDWSDFGGYAERRLWQLGAGLTWLPDPDHLVLVDCGWQDSRATAPDRAAADAGVFAVRIAVEARIHALLTLRAASGYRRQQVAFAGITAGTDHDVPLSAGLAAHAGPVDLEFALSNLRPVGPDGLPEPWSAPDAATWMSAGLSWWF